MQSLRLGVWLDMQVINLNGQNRQHLVHVSSRQLDSRDISKKLVININEI